MDALTKPSGLFGVAVCLMLVACSGGSSGGSSGGPSGGSSGGSSGGPSESDLHKAIRSQMDAETRATAFALSGGNAVKGEAFAKELLEQDKARLDAVNVKKLGCKEAQESTGYDCDVEISGPNGSVVSNLRFVKASDGWRVLPK